MAKDKLQKGIEGTTFKPQGKVLGIFGDSKESQKKMYNMTSALKRDAHRKGRVEGKKFRAKSFVDRKTGTLKLDTKSNRKRYGERVYKAPDVSYVEPIKYSKGGLKGNQKKLDKNNNNRIDSEDFKILRGKGKGAMKARLGSRVPPVIRPKPTAGGKPLTPKPIKPKPKPKMGGGMMKRYSKGGGADTGTMGEAKSKLATGIDAFKRRLKKEKLQAPKRPPMNPARAMGGGMIGKPMGYKSGTSVKVKCKLGRNKPTKMY